MDHPEWAESIPSETDKFILLVISMREAQKKFYNSKLNSHRDKAKAAEKLVDDWLWRRDNPNKERMLF